MTAITSDVMNQINYSEKLWFSVSDTYPVDDEMAEVAAADSPDPVASITSSLAADAMWLSVRSLSSEDDGTAEVMAADSPDPGMNGSPADAMWTSVKSLSSIFAPGETNSGVAITSALLLSEVFDSSTSSDTSEIIELSGKQAFVMFCIMICKTAHRIK